MTNNALTLPNPHEPKSPIIFVNLSQCKTLTSGNYPQWAAQIKSFLQGLDLFLFLDGTHACPSPKLPATSETTSPNDNPAYKTWCRQDQLLLGALLGSIDDSIAPLVTQASFSHEVWSILSTTYANPSRAHYQTSATPPIICQYCSFKGHSFSQCPNFKKNHPNLTIIPFTRPISMEVPDHSEKEKKILIQSIDPTFDTAEEHGMPIDAKTSFYRTRYHLVDLQHPEPQLNIGSSLLLYVLPGSLLALNDSVYLFGGLHPHECESERYLKLGPNPHVTYPNFHFGGSCLDLTLKQPVVWQPTSPALYDSITKNCVSYKGKIYTFGNAFFKPEVFDPVVGQWKLLHPPAAHGGSRVRHFPLSDPSNCRILVPVSDAQHSSTVLYEFLPPRDHPMAGNGCWKIISEDMDYWTDVAAVVENVIYFHSRKFPCLLRAYDVDKRTWLKVGGWDSCFEDGLNLNYERIEFTSLLNLGTRKLCFARGSTIYDDSIDKDNRRYLARIFFLKFQVERSGETVNLIPISSHIYKIPFTSQVPRFVAV